jgi:hypothetical protein
VDGDQTEGCAEKCPISQRLSAENTCAR